MKRIVLYPFSTKSEGYELLRDTLRKMLGQDAVLGVFADGKYKPKPNDLIVDWGFSKTPIWAATAPKDQILNKWERVSTAVNKIESFIRFRHNGVNCPDFTTNVNEAAYWVGQGVPVVQRSKVSSSKGKGASVAHKPAEFDAGCPLYTKMIPKKKEYRVHVFRGIVIDAHEKVYLGSDPKEFEIMFTVGENDSKWQWNRSGVILTPKVVVESVKAVNALGLDFGGVDVVTDATGRAYVLEVNTAPWLGTTTVKYYANALKKAAA
jgi:hypothetical protein